MKVWIACIAAVAVQPLVLIARVLPDYLAAPQPIYGAGLVLFGVVVVAAASVLVLGLPTFLLLRKMRRESWAYFALSGIVLGALPQALSWPRHLERYSSAQNWHGKYVQIYVSGNPTTYAWLQYGEDVAFFGLHGLVGALVFYGVLKRLERPNMSLQPTATPPSQQDDG